MNKFQLKKLIKEVLREVESEVEDPKTNTTDVDSAESIPPHELRKKQFGSSAPVLSLSLGGINKNNTKTLKDFIGMIAYAAGKLQLDIIHAELEKEGKLGVDMDKSDIEKSKKQTGGLEKPSTSLPKGWRRTPPDAATWKQMSPEERETFLIPGSHSDEWQAATDKDVKAAKQRPENNKNPNANLGTYNFGRGQTLPKNINLWNQDNWFTWETLPPSAKNMVKFMIPNMDTETWTDNDWKTWEKFNPQGKQKVQFNIPRYSPEDKPKGFNNTIR